MSSFQHPYLTRGVLYTSAGAFTVCRGVVEAPDIIGRGFGRHTLDDEPPADVQAEDRTDRRSEQAGDRHR